MCRILFNNNAVLDDEAVVAFDELLVQSTDSGPSFDDAAAMPLQVFSSLAL